MELYISSIVNGSQYLDIAVSRIFHLFSEMSSVQDIMYGSALLSNFVNFSLHVLSPYYNQIISKLNHPNSEIASGISNAVFKLMENCPNETF